MTGAASPGMSQPDAPHSFQRFSTLPYPRLIRGSTGGPTGKIAPTFGGGYPLAPAQQAPAPPEPHGPPDTSDEENTSSANDWANIAQYAPPAMSSMSESSIEHVALPIAYLHCAFIVQSNGSTSDVWIASCSASYHDAYHVRYV